MDSTERSRAYRERHPERDREQTRLARIRYRRRRGLSRDLGKLQEMATDETADDGEE